MQLPAASLNLGKHLLQAATMLNEPSFLANQKILNQASRLQQIPRTLDLNGEGEPVQEDAVAFGQVARLTESSRSPCMG